MEEDDFCPWWCTGLADWQGDKPEIYFDVNTGNLKDGQGPVDFPNGHYLFGPNFYDPEIHPYPSYQFCGEEFPGLSDFCYAYKFDSLNYVFEYAFPFNILTDLNGNILDPLTEPIIGFDVLIYDMDEGVPDDRQRAVWMQDGTGFVKDESWNNMDDAGEVIFSTQKVGKPQATIKKLPNGCEPVLDGKADNLWDQVECYNIDQDFIYSNVTQTLYNATWQALWNDTAIFLLVSVKEEYFCMPYHCTGTMSNRGDKPEVYFDVNIGNLDDGNGPAGFPNGHFVFAPGPTEDPDNSGKVLTSDVFFGDSWPGWYFGYAYFLENIYPADTIKYRYEYCIPFSSLVNSEGNPFNQPAEKTIGFDIRIYDFDGSVGENDIRSAVWSNIGENDENWNNMDDAGLLTFSTEEIDFDCATEIKTYQIVNFKIYPIPATDKIHISNTNELKKLTIFDITGNKIKTINSINTNELKIDIKSLKSGIYFIQFTDIRGHTSKQKFLKTSTF